MDVCDPGQDMKNIRKLVLVHTGKKLRMKREKVCEIFRLADTNKLPLPPLGITRDKKYLIDSKSPLTQGDYDVLFSSSSVSYWSNFWCFVNCKQIYKTHFFAVKTHIRHVQM